MSGRARGRKALTYKGHNIEERTHRDAGKARFKDSARGREFEVTVLAVLANQSFLRSREQLAIASSVAADSCGSRGAGIAVFKAGAGLHRGGFVT